MIDEQKLFGQPVRQQIQTVLEFSLGTVKVFFFFFFFLR